MLIERPPAPVLRGKVSRLCGFELAAPAPVRQREGPGADVVVVFAFEEHWLIDGERFLSFVAGMHERQVTTEHPGRSLGMQVDVDPLAARALLGRPLHELANRTVRFEDVVEEPFLVERLATARGWDERFSILETTLAPRLADARPSPEIAWAWGRLRATHGRARIGALAAELGWSRRRIAARFRDEVGLPPKAAARMLRFERARALAGTMPWAELAFECGYYDQSHLIAEFRAIAGRPPGTFLQDEAAHAS